MIAEYLKFRDFYNSSMKVGNAKVGRSESILLQETTIVFFAVLRRVCRFRSVWFDPDLARVPQSET